MTRISSSVRTIGSRAPSSSISARMRRLVMGVRRSWPTAASVRVRSASKRAMRACMSLKAAAASRSSRAPSSGTRAVRSPRPAARATAASSPNGRVRRRTNRRPTPSTATSDASTTVTTAARPSPRRRPGGERRTAFSHSPPLSSPISWIERSRRRRPRNSARTMRSLPNSSRIRSTSPRAFSSVTATEGREVISTRAKRRLVRRITSARSDRGKVSSRGTAPTMRSTARS